MASNNKAAAKNNKTDQVGDDEEYDHEILRSLMRDEGDTNASSSISKVPGLYHSGESGRHTVHDMQRIYASSPLPDLREGSKSVPNYTDIKKGLSAMEKKRYWGGKTRQRRRARKTVKRGMRKKTRRARTTKRPVRRFRSKTAGKRRAVSRKRKTRARNH